MSDEKKSQPIVSPSPVADVSNMKEWRPRFILMGLCVLVMIGFWFYPNHKTSTPKPENEAMTDRNVSAPQISKTEQQLKEITSVLEEKQNTLSLYRQEEAEKLRKMRLVASTTVYSASGIANSNPATQSVPGTQAVLGGTGDSNTQFMARLSNSTVPVVNAVRMEHPNTTLGQGTMIWATLEARIASDLPGMLRAVTSEDIYSEDGSTVLLPRGSRLIGQYTNSIAQGQYRVFVVWQRVIRPDHIGIQLNSPGTDMLGTAGVAADTVDHHFFEQFGTAALLSIISAGAANIGVNNEDQFNSAAAYREALSNSLSQTAQNTLHSTGVIQPTLYIQQGKKISVFVAHDLDFYNELSRQGGAL